MASNGVGRPSIPKLKLKTKLSGKNYNPYKESEYHYGSDFEEDEDEYDDGEASDKSSDLSDLESGNGADSDDLVESDVDLDGEIDEDELDDQTPVPFWLRDNEDIPPLELPFSSEDLLIPNEYVLRVMSIYEVLRRFRQILRLSPFRIEDFGAALTSDEQSNLLSEVHISLLRAVVRAEDANSVTFGPIDQKDSTNCIFFFMDSVSWPDSLRSFLESDTTQYAEPLEIFKSAPEYPFASTREEQVESRVHMLGFLTDQILLSANVRDFITDDATQTTEEHCRICHRLGEMLVCDSCFGVFHLTCLDPPLEQIPEDEWRCYVCTANETEGVTDCPNPGEGRGGNNANNCRLNPLGVDRIGNRYWFLCRRLVVEKTDGSISYYSTVKQLEELSEVLDDDLYERDLWGAMENIRLEMERQMDITEEMTASKRANSKKTYFEVENGEFGL